MNANHSHILTLTSYRIPRYPGRWLDILQEIYSMTNYLWSKENGPHTRKEVGQVYSWIKGCKENVQYTPFI